MLGVGAVDQLPQEGEGPAQDHDGTSGLHVEESREVASARTSAGFGGYIMLPTFSTQIIFQSNFVQDVLRSAPGYFSLHLCPCTFAQLQMFRSLRRVNPTTLCWVAGLGS